MVGLLASRARRRLARQEESSASGVRSKEREGKQQQEKVIGRQEGAKAESRKVREEGKVAPGGPELTVLCVMVRVH